MMSDLNLKDIEFARAQVESMGAVLAEGLEQNFRLVVQGIVDGKIELPDASTVALSVAVVRTHIDLAHEHRPEGKRIEALAGQIRQYFESLGDDK